MSSQRAIDPAYLRYQYATSEKLRIRIETHARYTQWSTAPADGQADPFFDGLLRHLQLRPGLRVLDVGCGPGTIHARLPEVRIVGVDTSFGMLREARRGRSGHYAQADAQQLPRHVRRECALAAAHPHRLGGDDRLAGQVALGQGAGRGEGVE